MPLRHPRLRRKIAEHPALLCVRSPHLLLTFGRLYALSGNGHAAFFSILLKPLSDLAASLLPIFTSVSILFTVCGPFLLQSYLESLKAPFPTPDSTFLSLVLLV